MLAMHIYFRVIYFHLYLDSITCRDYYTKWRRIDSKTLEQSIRRCRELDLWINAPGTQK